MKIDSVHAEFMSGNAVSSTTSSHSIVSRDASGDIQAAGVTISGNSGTLFSYSDGTRSVYGGCNASDPWFGTSSNHDLRLVTSGSERMRIDNAGNVGIGTSSPGTKFDVVGDPHTFIRKMAEAGTLTDDYNHILGGPRPGTTSAGAVHFINGSTRSDDGGNNTYTIRNDSGKLRLGHASFDTLLEGNVGIGKASPSYTLDVDGDINVSSGKKFRIDGTALENSATIEATSTNVASNIVVRDASGDFSAGTITAALIGNASSATNADKLDGVHLDDIFNNMGGAHGARTDFDAVPDAGCYYIMGSTNGPGVNGATQYYGFTLGLGGYDPVVEGHDNGKYGCQMYWGRNVGNPYINIRYLENGAWGSWNKAAAGYADSAGYATSAGSAAACSGNAATATKLNTARTIGGVSFDGSGNIDLKGVNIAGDQDTSGNAATATTAASCSGNAATASSCSGNALTVTRKENYVHTYITSATFASSGISQSSSGYIPSSSYSFWNGYNNLSIPDAVDYNDGRSLIVSLDLSFFGEVVCNNNENVMFSIDMAITNSGNYWITTLSSSAPSPGNRTKGITTHNINFWRDHYSTGETINITTRFVIPNSYLGYNYKIFPTLVAWTGNISDGSGLRVYTNRTRSDNNDWTYERGLTVGRVIFQKE